MFVGTTVYNFVEYMCNIILSVLGKIFIENKLRLSFKSLNYSINCPALLETITLKLSPKNINNKQNMFYPKI